MIGPTKEVLPNKAGLYTHDLSKCNFWTIALWLFTLKTHCQQTQIEED